MPDATLGRRAPFIRRDATAVHNLHRSPTRIQNSQPGVATLRPERAQEVIAVMTRYGFSIRTKSGQRVDNISIMALCQEDAERRLRQMYVQCQVVECRAQAVPRRLDALDMRAVVGLMAGRAPSFEKAGTH